MIKLDEVLNLLTRVPHENRHTRVKRLLQQTILNVFPLFLEYSVDDWAILRKRELLYNIFGRTEARFVL